MRQGKAGEGGGDSLFAAASSSEHKPLAARMRPAIVAARSSGIACAHSGSPFACASR